jgi:hypothetical protein
MNFSDRALLVFFMSVSSLIGFRAYRVSEWGKLFAVNGRLPRRYCVAGSDARAIPSMGIPSRLVSDGDVHRVL